MRRRRTVAVALGVTSLLFLGATARLFVFPRRDAPAPVDAIVMFAGSPGRLEHAVALAVAGYAPTLAVSVPTVDDLCPPPIPEVEVICFAPDPLTTQGESRWTAAAAARHGWRSILVITSTSQTTRARLRLARCYPGQVLMSPVPPPRLMWPYMIAYEWAAMGKALVVQREC
ncbi:YdcF family protein [Parafrankia sp. FMc2]